MKLCVHLINAESLFRKAPILLELVIKVYKLFHSIVDKEKKVFLKRLGWTLNRGILSHCLALHDLESTGTNL